MILWNYYKQKAIAEGREEGIAEGIAEGKAEGIAEANQAWASWLERKETAEANGKSFNEPPPSSREASSDK